MGPFSNLTSFTQHNVFRVHPRLQHESVPHSFTLLNNIPLYGQTTFYLSFYLLIHILDCCHLLVIMNNTTVKIHAKFPEHKFSILLGIYT